MKICVTSEGSNLESKIDSRFGRCKYFIIVDIDSMKFDAIENPNISAMGGAGIQSGQFIANKGVKSVLSGNIGPNAFQTLQAAGLDVITGVTGTVKEVIDKYKQGEYKISDKPSVDKKFGT